MTIDATIQCGDWDAVRHALNSIAESCLTLAQSPQFAEHRTERNVALFSIVRRTGVEVIQCANAIDRPVECSAWSARNLFELNISLRYIMQDEFHLRGWMTQAASDEIEVIEGAIALHQGTSDPKLSDALRKLSARSTELEELLSKHGRKRVKLFLVANLAKSVGMEGEYKAFFKLYSKYVHPSSFLVNRDPQYVQAWQWRTMFTMSAQLYANDIVERIRHAIGAVDHPDI